MPDQLLASGNVDAGEAGQTAKVSRAPVIRNSFHRLDLVVRKILHKHGAVGELAFVRFVHVGKGSFVPLRFRDVAFINKREDVDAIVNGGRVHARKFVALRKRAAVKSEERAAGNIVRRDQPPICIVELCDAVQLRPRAQSRAQAHEIHCFHRIRCFTR